MTNAIDIYHPQQKLWEGNVFTGACQLFCSQVRGGWVSLALSGKVSLVPGPFWGWIYPEEMPTWKDYPLEGLTSPRQDKRIRLSSRQYASYWNVVLLLYITSSNCKYLSFNKVNKLFGFAIYTGSHLQ